jgi:ATPase subunit of ABC transporter with duplicated ATPase domains
MEGIEWFISFLRQSKAAVVMVSHNRHLLDATVDQIWELHGRKVTAWTGGYSDFQRQKAEAIALQERQFKSQQRLIKRIEFQARRLLDMAKAYDDPGQAKRAKAMLKRIDQMDKLEAPNKSENRFHANLSGGARHGRIALEIAGLAIGVRAAAAAGDRTTTIRPVDPRKRIEDEPTMVAPDAAEDSDSDSSKTPSSRRMPSMRKLLNGANLSILYGQRVALVGPNGSGKSTLFKAILNHAQWDNPNIDVSPGPFHIQGLIRTGKSARIGDYSQIHDEKLPHDKTLT